jgi:hypothetical protein
MRPRGPPRAGCWITPIRVTVPARPLICAVGPCQASQGMGGWLLLERPGGSRPDGCDRAPAAASVIWRAARRAERGALDRCRGGAIGVCGVCARAPMLILVLDPLVGDGAGEVMVMGCRSRWGEVRCGRSVFPGRPRGRGGSGLRGAGRGASADVGRWRTRASSCGSERLVAEFPEGVVAAFEEFAGDR